LHPLKRYAATLLIAALALAVLTPAYLVHAVPETAVYYTNIWLVVMQVVPYAVCAAIWLPMRHPSAPKTALRLSMLLFLAAVLLYLPVWIHPRSGGDMAALGYILVCMVTTGTVLVISMLVLVVSWWSRRSSHVVN
jgi:hypothetical protein